MLKISTEYKNFIDVFYENTHPHPFYQKYYLNREATDQQAIQSTLEKQNVNILIKIKTSGANKPLYVRYFNTKNKLFSHALKIKDIVDIAYRVFIYFSTLKTESVGTRLNFLKKLDESLFIFLKKMELNLKFFNFSEKDILDKKKLIRKVYEILDISKQKISALEKQFSKTETKIDFFALPTDLRNAICLYLSLPDIAACRRTCKKFNSELESLLNSNLEFKLISLNELKRRLRIYRFFYINIFSERMDCLIKEIPIMYKWYLLFYSTLSEKHLTHFLVKNPIYFKPFIEFIFTHSKTIPNIKITKEEFDLNVEKNIFRNFNKESITNIIKNYSTYKENLQNRYKKNVNENNFNHINFYILSTNDEFIKKGTLERISYYQQSLENKNETPAEYLDEDTIATIHANEWNYWLEWQEEDNRIFSLEESDIIY